MSAKGTSAILFIYCSKTRIFLSITVLQSSWVGQMTKTILYSNNLDYACIHRSIIILFKLRYTTGINLIEYR